MNVQDAAYGTVHDYPGGSESLAPRIGMSAAVLRGKVNPHNDRNVLALAEADQIMGVTGDFRMLHALAAQHGFALAPIESEGGGDITVAMLGAAAAKGDLATVITRALQDGLISGNELAEIGRACAALQASIVSVARGAAARAAAGQPKPGDRL